MLHFHCFAYFSPDTRASSPIMCLIQFYHFKTTPVKPSLLPEHQIFLPLIKTNNTVFGNAVMPARCQKMLSALSRVIHKILASLLWAGGIFSTTQMQSWRFRVLLCMWLFKICTAWKRQN